jgi:hypothetical protein
MAWPISHSRKACPLLRRHELEQAAAVEPGLGGDEHRAEDDQQKRRDGVTSQPHHESDHGRYVLIAHDRIEHLTHKGHLVEASLQVGPGGRQNLSERAELHGQFRAEQPGPQS